MSKNSLRKSDDNIALSYPSKGSSGLQADPGDAARLQIRIAEWVEAYDRRTGLELRWQTLESQLFREAKRQGTSCTHASEGNSPQACEMRSLSAEIEDLDKWLAATAGELIQLRSRTLACAMAKIELGLKIQGTFHWTDHAREFLEDGVSELKAALDPAHTALHLPVR